jgi:ferritin-like metal-binding protein YciE
VADDVTRSVFVTGLKNAHALEHEALALLNRQIDRLTNYEEVAERLRQHRDETEEQVGRLEAIFTEIGESRSAIKDVVMALSGSLAALGHTLAGDEILKNTFANQAFENFEIASYRSLITVAEAAGYDGVIPLLQETLREEEAMAAWVADSVPLVTRKFLTLKQAGEDASH